jgi:hypothetical protein
MDYNDIKRIVYTRTVIQEDKKYFSASSCITGKYEDGTYYFRNEFTELPNDFELIDDDIVHELYRNVLKSLKSNIKKGKKSNKVGTFDIYKVYFEKPDGNPINETFCFKNPLYSPNAEFSDLCHGKDVGVNIDELRHDADVGHIPFTRFFNHRVEYLVSNLYNDVDTTFEINPDSSIDIKENCGGKTKEIVITIDGEGNIEKHGDYPYVRALKNTEVSITF